MTLWKVGLYSPQTATIHTQLPFQLAEKTKRPPVPLEGSSVCKWPWSSIAKFTGRPSTSTPPLLWVLSWLWWGGGLCQWALMETLTLQWRAQDKIRAPSLCLMFKKNVYLYRSEPQIMIYPHSLFKFTKRSMDQGTQMLRSSETKGSLLWDFGLNTNYYYWPIDKSCSW